MIFARYLLLGALAVSSGTSVFAAEGGSSNYLPGAIGGFGVALPPEPGWQAADVLWVQSGDVGATVLEGQVDIGVDIDVVLNLVNVTHTFNETLFGANYTIGAVFPFGYANLDASARGPGGTLPGVEADKFDLADVSLTPIQLNWSAGDFHFRLQESIIVPVGGYDVDDSVNLGRNYWGFETRGAVTWLNSSTGTEVSAAPGVMLNTRNKETEYRTGHEFYVDFMANQFLTESFAAGLRGYYYRQITADDGEGRAFGFQQGRGPGARSGVSLDTRFREWAVKHTGAMDARHRL